MARKKNINIILPPTQSRDNPAHLFMFMCFFFLWVVYDNTMWMGRCPAQCHNHISTKQMPSCNLSQSLNFFFFLSLSLSHPPPVPVTVLSLPRFGHYWGFQKPVCFKSGCLQFLCGSVLLRSLALFCADLHTFVLICVCLRPTALEWNVPGFSLPTTPQKFPWLPQKTCRGQPLSFGSLTPSDDSQDVPLISLGLTGHFRHPKVFLKSSEQKTLLKQACLVNFSLPWAPKTRQLIKCTASLLISEATFLAKAPHKCLVFLLENVAFPGKIASIVRKWRGLPNGSLLNDRGGASLN